MAEEKLEAVVGKLLKAKNLTIACAESCTGGLLTSRLTDIPGSSDYVMGSVVCYTNPIKERLVGVTHATIAKYTEVSEQCAREMAEGIARNIRTDIGVGITGIAGPGGYEGHPEGLVYIAVAGANGTVVKENHFHGTRISIKEQSAEMALAMTRDYLTKK